MTAEPRQPSKDHLPCRCSGGFSTRRWSLLQRSWYHVLLLPSSGSISSNLAVLLVSTHNAVTSLGHELMNVEPCSHHTRPPFVKTSNHSPLHRQIDNFWKIYFAHFPSPFSPFARQGEKPAVAIAGRQFQTLPYRRNLLRANIDISHYLQVH